MTVYFARGKRNEGNGTLSVGRMNRGLSGNRAKIDFNGLVCLLLNQKKRSGRVL